ncbi:hypothetical protein BCR79_10000 [Escherichia coli]|nr:hypothetical protein BCR79_10000 [Escherichia coli]
MNKFYKGSFYPKALKGVYISAGSWPENGADVDDETMAIYTGVAPQGKTLGLIKMVILRGLISRHSPLNNRLFRLNRKERYCVLWLIRK